MRSAFFKNERRGALVPGLKLVSGPASMNAIEPHIRQLKNAGSFGLKIGFVLNRISVEVAVGDAAESGGFPLAVDPDRDRLSGQVMAGDLA